ncbi:NAD(P)/FAD-dependent oxidoreductase, partial [Noviherbaspirillum denitrificans]|uniref:NAD(P)/FAD-dependent oxidoreductase n=1 Tax=Noviherbaspirillum denitrificans TaxID=1968433 RepID=UPI001483BC9E
GPAGLSFAITAAERGHEVVVFDAQPEIGGQLNVAKKVPGKEEFYEMLRYFEKQIALRGVKVVLNTRVRAEQLQQGGYDDIVLATGVTPRTPPIDGVDHPKVLGYLDVLRDEKPVGKTVAVIGAGGIGFDVAEYLTHSGESASVVPEKFYAEWGVDTAYGEPGGLRPPHVDAPVRKVIMFQRKASKVGDNLGKTTGWIHRAGLKARRVGMEAGISYRRIDDQGLHITAGGEERVIPVDNVILCTGQEPLRELFDDLKSAGCSVHLIGGADVAAELDAKRAIDQGTRLAAAI